MLLKLLIFRSLLLLTPQNILKDNWCSWESEGICVLDDIIHTKETLPINNSYKKIRESLIFEIVALDIPSD